MIWLAFNVKFGISREYRRIPKDVRADHLVLLLYCAEQENGGVLENAGAYTLADWRCLPVDRAEVDAMVAAGLACWRPSAQLPLTPEKPDLEIHDEIRQNRDEIRQKVDLGDQNDGSRQDLEIHDEIRHPDLCDLVVLYYDVGGEERNRELSDAGYKGAISRWNTTPEQRSLPFPPMPPSVAPEPPSGGAPPPRDPPRSTGSRDPANGQANGQANARHGTERQIPPPNPLPGGGGRSFIRNPSRTAWLRFLSFWTWLQENRPAILDRFKWGGAKRRVRYVIWRQAAEIARLRHQREPTDEDVLALLDVARQDLGRKFRDREWLRRQVDSKPTPSIVTYFSQEEYDCPLEERPPKLELVPPFEHDAAAPVLERDRAADEEMLRDLWREEMQDEPIPEDLGEARRRLSEKHGWKA